jgi:hypothetical protein
LLSGLRRAWPRCGFGFRLVERFRLRFRVGERFRFRIAERFRLRLHERLRVNPLM